MSDSLPSNQISVCPACLLPYRDPARPGEHSCFDARGAEIERLEAHVRLLQRDNANLKAHQDQLNAEATRKLARLDDSAFWRWLMEDGDRCASVVADAYTDWDTDESWELTLKREIDSHSFAPESKP